MDIAKPSLFCLSWKGTPVPLIGCWVLLNCEFDDGVTFKKKLVSIFGIGFWWKLMDLVLLLAAAKVYLDRLNLTGVADYS